MDADEKTALLSRIAELEAENAVLRQREEERLKARQQDMRLEHHLQSLGPDFQENIVSLVELCGDFLGGACSFYNRLRGDRLIPYGQWNVSPDFNPGEGLTARLCKNLLSNGGEKFLYIPCLDEDILSSEPEFDSPVAGFRSFLGRIVEYGDTSVGVLCVLHRESYILTEPDQRIMTILATVIADEDRRNEAMVALRESEERFYQLAEYLPGIAIQGYRPDGKVFYWNRGSEEVYGYAADEALGRDLCELIIPECQQPLFREGLQAVESIEKSGMFIPPGEFELKRKDGSSISVYSIQTAVCSPDREPSLFCLDIDLSHQKEREKALRDSEERFRGLVDGTHDIVYAIDAEGCCTFIGPQVRRYGFTPDELLGKNFLDLISGEDRELLAADFEKSRDRSQSHSQMVFRKMLPDGRIVWLENTGTSLYDNAGNFISEIGTMRDITERKCLEEALQQAGKERLEMERRLHHAQRLESLGLLAGGIAHDFNNLLMGIMGNLEMAQLELAPFSKVQSYLDASLRSALHASDITRQMLAYSGQGRFLIQEVDLDDLIQEMLSLLESSLMKTAVLRLDLCGFLPTISADAEQIRQVIMNLAINASEAIVEDTGTVTLKTRVMSCNDAFLCQSCLEDKPPAGRFVLLEVADTGCGMNKETRDRLFDPFFTTKFAGRGLGMSAVLGIIRGHGGAILVDSEPMQGTVVQVLFPLKRLEAFL